MPTNGVIETNGHTTSYLEGGPKDGPLIVFVHGWPELSHSWRHQLPAMARLGFTLLHRICAVTADRQNTGNTPPTPKKTSLPICFALPMR